MIISLDANRQADLGTHPHRNRIYFQELTPDFSLFLYLSDQQMVEMMNYKGPFDSQQDSTGLGSLFRLPPIVRMKIWRFVVEAQPRLLAYEHEHHLPSWSSRYRRKAPFDQTLKKQPEILSICLESRMYATNIGVHGTFGHKHMWWFPNTDMLYFSRPSSWVSFHRATENHNVDRTLIKNLAILAHDRVGWTITRNWYNFEVVVDTLKQLQNIHLFAVGSEIDLTITSSNEIFREPWSSLTRPYWLTPIDEDWEYPGAREVEFDGIAAPSNKFKDIRPMLKQFLVANVCRDVNIVGWVYQRKTQVK